MATETQSWARRAGRWYGNQSKGGQVAAMIVAAIVGLSVLLGFFRLFGDSFSGGGAGGIVALVIIGLLYFLPSMVAWGRDTPNKNSVFVINIFLGWTLIGWVVALAMAVSQADTKKPSTVRQLDASNEKPAPATAAAP